MANKVLSLSVSLVNSMTVSLSVQMSRRTRYKRTEDVLDAIFALPSDPEQSTDDEEESDSEDDHSIVGGTAHDTHVFIDFYSVLFSLIIYFSF